MILINYNIFFLFYAFEFACALEYTIKRATLRPAKKEGTDSERDEIFIDFMMCMQEAIFSAQDWTWVYPMEVCVSVYERVCLLYAA